jgi:hypothetical protein
MNFRSLSDKDIFDALVVEAGRIPRRPVPARPESLFVFENLIAVGARNLSGKYQAATRLALLITGIVCGC